MSESRVVDSSAPSDPAIVEHYRKFGWVLTDDLAASEVEELRESMEPVISEIASQYGSRQNALRTLMALLAVESKAESQGIEVVASEKGA